MIAVSPSSGFCRWSKGFRTMNIEAKLELLACSRNDIPTKQTEWAIPGVFRGIPATRLATSRVRSSDAESGSWTMAISRPWSCSGMNPVGAVWKTQQVRASSTP